MTTNLAAEWVAKRLAVIDQGVASGLALEDAVALADERHPRPPVPLDEAEGADLLEAVHVMFRRWLGAEYDIDGLDATLAAAAVEQLDGDPVWLLIVGGPGNAKTETVQTLVGAGATVTSVISSEGALLSGTAKKERTSEATGGLLPKLGPRGILVIKDVTSILSMSREVRGGVLAALREVYDGRWERNVGTDGGRTLTWEGRLVVIGAVTTAWDAAHGVIAAMGDRFALLRLDSTVGRMASGRQALHNVGSEVQMRAELAEAVGEVLARIQPERAVLNEDDVEVLLRVANLVTLARTAVEHDSRGEVIDAHAPEAPTRFAKMLGQIVRGGLAVGLSHDAALRLACRIGRDSMPPARLDALADVYEHPLSSVPDVRRRLQKPRNTVDRTLQELHLLGLVHLDESPNGLGILWRYRVSDDFDAYALSLTLPGKVSRSELGNKREGSEECSLLTDISGTASRESSCLICGEPLDPSFAALGLTTHPTCAR